MSRLLQRSHSNGESALHLQLTPKYRRPVFTDNLVREECRRLFGLVATQLGVDLVAAEFGPDHVHLFVRNWKDHSISRLAQHFKGRSSFELRKHLADRLAVFGPSDSFWSDGYFYETVGSFTAEAKQRYVQQGQRKHWVNQLSLDL